MNKILVIGCPGSGKSTFSKRLTAKIGFALLHLDMIYHIDNYHNISREEFLKKIEDFIVHNESFIIDGNFSATLEYRLTKADTVILFDIDTEVCLTNVITRLNQKDFRDDMAPGFDNSIMDDDFLDFVRNFKSNRLPVIETMLADFSGTVIRFHDYTDVEEFFGNLENMLHHSTI